MQSSNNIVLGYSWLSKIQYLPFFLFGEKIVKEDFLKISQNAPRNK